ncbi:MAG: DNA internalization-related competence protein ComEC/Rec2 [Marinobacter sp.]|nr:DNA internalization-related competence protein ComEC/Rec2 [Marinobacter sp.]
MRAGIAAFAGGVILLYWGGWLPALPHLLLSISLFLSVVALLWRGYLRSVLLIAACLALGFSYATWHAHERLGRILAAPVEAQVWGYVCSLPDAGSYQRFYFEFCVTGWAINQPAPPITPPPQRVRLSWSGAEAPPIGPLALTVSMVPPQGQVNPAGFRYETWLFRHGIGATGRVQALDKDPSHGLSCPLGCRYHSLRFQVANGLQVRWGDLQHYPLFASLVMGDRRFLDSQWQVLRDTGTAHLLAISGLHVGLVAGLFATFAQLLLRLLPTALVGPQQRRIWVAAAAMMSAGIYALLAGFTIPTRRALIMVVVAAWVLARARGREAGRAWLLALFVVLLLDPFAPLDPGFWLSFAAVGILLLVFSARVARPGYLAGLLLAQLAVTILLWPVLYLAELPVAGLGLLANLLAIPWVSVVVMPVLMLTLVLGWLISPLVSGLGGVADLTLALLWRWLEMLAQLPVPMTAPGFTVVLALTVAVALVLLVPDRSARIALAAMVVLAGAATMLAPVERAKAASEGASRLWVFDQGQGQMLLYENHGQRLLIGAGPGRSEERHSLDATLAALDVLAVDAWVLMHGGAEHADGVTSLWQRIQAHQVVAGHWYRVADRLPGEFDRLQPCLRQDSALGNAMVEFWPLQGPGAEDELTCAVVIRGQGYEIVLPGDLTIAGERRWLAVRDFERPQDSQRILIAGRYGSRQASGAGWVKQLAPDLVIFTAGRHHRFGYPHPQVAERYRHQGARMLHTGELGALRLELADPIHISAGRENAPFWIRPAISD